MKIPVGPAIAIAAVAIIAAMIGGGWWWWEKNAEKLKESAQAAYLDGQRAGASLTESGCVDGAVARHKISDNQTILETVRTSLTLRGCLDASKAEPRFCDGVPAKDELLARGTWGGERCARAGLTDAYCVQVMSQIIEYCADRRTKS